MKIRNVVHKGLRRFIEHDDASGLNRQAVEKIRVIVTFLSGMGKADELRKIPMWKAHRLSGDQKGRWSLTVTRNWRLTFYVDDSAGEIFDLDYEDYH